MRDSGNLLVASPSESDAAALRLQLPEHARGPPHSMHQRRRIAERYAAGETMAELAREYECGEATIWRALQKALRADPGRGQNLPARLAYIPSGTK